jgi:hypothetical protein
MNVVNIQMVIYVIISTWKINDVKYITTELAMNGFQSVKKKLIAWQHIK